MSDRRRFLIHSAAFLLGTLSGLNSFSKALASGKYEKRSFLAPKMALIIDDIGYSPSCARRFLAFDIPMTFSILPDLPNSQTLAMEIHRLGQQVMLHQPMEPNNSKIDPGPGALYVEDKAGKILRTMEQNILNTPFIVGVNNHMGSKFTSSLSAMNQTLVVIKEKDLFFIDSLTTPLSKAYETAKDLQIPTACRNVFLDNNPTLPSILSQLRKLRRYAHRHGHAIGIGHPYKETAEAIGLFLNDLKDSETSLVHATEILKT